MVVELSDVISIVDAVINAVVIVRVVFAVNNVLKMQQNNFSNNI